MNMQLHSSMFMKHHNIDHRMDKLLIKNTLNINRCLTLNQVFVPPLSRINPPAHSGHYSQSRQVDEAKLTVSLYDR